MRNPSGFDFMIAKWQRQREGNSVFDNQERNKLINILYLVISLQP